MSDDRLNFGDLNNGTEDQVNRNDAVSGAGDQNIVDGTAEVVSEVINSADDAAAVHDTAAEQKYDYEQVQDESTGSVNYANAESDAASATGNGSYQYAGSTHEYYQGENFGSSVSGGSGGNSGGRSKVIIAVVLAMIFGICVGLGAWGVHHHLSYYYEDEETADAAEEEDEALIAENNEEASQTDSADIDPAGGAQQQTDPAAETKQQQTDPVADAQQQTDPAAGTQQQTDPAADAQQQTDPAAGTQQQTDPAAGTQQQTDPAADAQQQTGNTEANNGNNAGTTKNEAGLIISDAETQDTELTRVVESVMPSIVSVYNDFSEEIQTFYGETFTRQGESTGSGIIIGMTDSELLIVTNNHVVEGADHLRVLFIDEEACDAELKGTDPSNDLAVIVVSLDNIKSTTRDKIKVATLGNSDRLKIGESVIAIGNALGYGQSVTTGVVSANNREISDNTVSGTFIQTDAAINPGNSGGALVNTNGHVIGINSSKIGGDTVEGMGFAIPISRAIPIIEQLMSRETLSKVDESEQGTIGISGATVTSDVASAYNMPQGVFVAQIIEGGGAASSDLREGDIITGINDQPISSMDELQRMLQYYKAGTEVTLTVQRQDGNGSYAETKVNVTLGTRESIQNNAQNQNGSQGFFGPGNRNSQQDQENDQENANPSANPFQGFGFPFGF